MDDEQFLTWIQNNCPSSSTPQEKNYPMMPLPPTNLSFASYASISYGVMGFSPAGFQEHLTSPKMYSFSESFRV